MDNLSDISNTGLLSDNADSDYLEPESSQSQPVNEAQQEEIEENTDSISWSINENEPFEPNSAVEEPEAEQNESQDQIENAPYETPTWDLSEEPDNQSDNNP